MWQMNALSVLPLVVFTTGIVQKPKLLVLCPGLYILKQNAVIINTGL